MSNGHRSLRHIAKRLTDKRAVPVVAAALLASAVLAPLPGAATPVDPQRPAAPHASHVPLTIAAAQHRIALLNHEAEIAAEQMNTLRVQIGTAHDRLSTLRADVSRQRTRVAALRADIVGTAVTEYQGGAGLSTPTSFLVAHNPRQFLTTLANSAVAAQQETGLLTSLTSQQRRLGAQQQQARRELAAIAADKGALAHHQEVLRSKTRQTQQVLASLREKQRERLARQQARAERRAAAQASRDAQRVSTTAAPAPPNAAAPTAPAPASPATTPAPPVSAPPASGRAQAAVGYALAQLGDPYVYGAAGPDAFDCSGLTMAAWAAAGVSIPHSAIMQVSAGTPVSISELMPGDLVFYYSPISHVGMYIGNGQVVHAPHTGSVVQIVPVNSMPISTAVRIG
jgi:cell wall-associated NlpC family hydrolase